jgi:integrase
MQNNFANEKSNDGPKDRLIAELRADNERLRALQGKALAGVLTDDKIAKLKRRGRHRDQENLYIQVPSEGSKKRSWLFGWTVNRQFRQFGLGSYPDVNIQKARADAQVCRLALQNGSDPETEYKKRRQSITVASGKTRTVMQVGIEWFNTKIKSKNPKYAGKIENQLNKYVYSTIGHMLIDQIDQTTILDDAEPDTPRIGLKRLWCEMWPTGHDVQNYLDRIFAYGIYKGYNDKNPAAKSTLQYLLPDKGDVYERKSRDSLPIDEMYDFLQKLRAIKDRSVRKTGHPMMALLIEALAYTGVRISELIEAEQGEFNYDTMTWNVPWQHRKNGKKKKAKRPIRPIPITPSFLRVLNKATAKRKQLNLTDQDDALMFPSDKHGHIGKMIKTSSPSTFIKRNFPKLKLHPHGFRSTLRDWRRLRASHFEDVCWKIQVDHKTGNNESDDAYGPDLLMEKRRPMMTEYDKFISNPPPPKAKAGNVADINSARKRRTA